MMKNNFFTVVFKKNAITIVLLLSAFFSVLEAQVSTYTFAEDLEVYSELNLPYTVAYGEIGVGYNNHTNGNAHLADLGFTFIFDGLPYTQCYVSTNGFITLGNTQPLLNTYGPLGVATGYSGAISAFGQYIRSDTDQIIYKTTGNAPNRVFTIQWKNVYRNADTFKNLFNFQIKLYETSNLIEFHYGQSFPENTDPITVQVGLRGPSNIFAQGNVINRLQNNTNGNVTWALNTMPGTVSSHSLRTSATEYPDNGLVLKFTPSLPCSTPSGSPTNFVIGSSGVTLDRFNGNSFDIGTSNATNFLVLRSLINVPPTPAQITNRTFFTINQIIDDTYRVISNSSNTTFNQTGLDSNTTYYYWVIPFNSNCLGAPIYHFGGMISASNTTCIPATTLSPLFNITGNGFSASWLPVPNATNYIVQVSLNSGFNNLVPGFESISSGGLTTINVDGLQPLLLYYVRIRAVGNGPCSVNSNSQFILMPCGYYTIPYSQNFDATAINSIPNCFAVQNENLDSNQWNVQAINSASAPRSLYLNTNSSEASNDWFFLPGLQLEGSRVYRLKYKINTGANETFNERLRIRIGNSQSTAGMTTTLQDLPTIVNTIYQENFVDFSVASNGVYYLGFQAYSAQNQSYIVIDDILIEFAPTCFMPESVTLLNVTSDSALIGFEEPDTLPANGYEYYLSTTSLTPDFFTIPSGNLPLGSNSLTISGLSSSASYYIWFRGNCSLDDKSEWSFPINFTTECIPPQILNSFDAERCGIGSLSLQAIPNIGATIEWFGAINGPVLHTGQIYTTAALSNSTTFYARAKSAGSIKNVGLQSLNAVSGSRIILNNPIGTNLTITEQTTLLSFDIFPVSSGQNGLIVIRNSLGSPVYSQSFTTTTVGGIQPQTIPINFSFQPGNYLVDISSMPTSGLITNAENVMYPFTSSVSTLTGNNFDNVIYSCLYNWKFTSTCFSDFQSVNATISSPPPISLSAPQAVICNGDSTPAITLTGALAYNNFVWSPNIGVSGNASTGFIFNPSESTVYTLTASQTTGLQCVTTASFGVIVNPTPPDITIVPSSADLCENEIQSFSATFGTSSEINIFLENFENDVSGWTITNFSNGGNVISSQWTLRNSPYSYVSPYWNINVNSNDTSKFFFANSDAQGSPSSNLTLTHLISPTFSLDGYTSASLSFWTYLRWIVGNKAHVEISVDNGVNWALIGSYTGIVGSASNFANRIIDLNPYVGNSEVKLRFLYEATWDYGWAIDNIVVSGTVSTAVDWSPVDDLYIDDLATIPYTAGTPAGTVYCLPTTDRMYTARVNTIDGCFSEATFNVGFSPKPVGGIVPSGENLCVGGTPANLTLTGYSGDILRWERADDAAFTLNVTPIANTSDVLTPAQMGAITSVRYFRAVVGSGVCPAEYSNVAEISFPTSVWNGTVWSNGVPDASTQAIINVVGNATIATNIEACTLQVVSGNISVASGVTIHLQGTLNVAGGSLTFENEASLLQVDDTPNTGTIVYKRDSQPMWLFDYTYWSSPVASQNVKQFSPNTNWLRFYTYQGGVNWVQVFANQAAFAAGTATMTPALGYIVRSPGSGVPQFFAFGNPSGPTVYPGVFTGVPNNGTYTAPINITVANIFNFVGNPYPSALDIHEFFLDPDNLGVIERTVYLWTHNTPITNNDYNAGDYATYNFMGGVSSDPGTGAPSPNPGVNTNAPTRYVASGQGFILYGLTNGTVSFKNSMRVAGNNNSFFRMASPNEQTDAIESIEKYRLWLNMTNQTNLNQQLMVGFSAMASEGYDDGFDAKAPISGYGLQFYSLLDDLSLSIQAKGLPFHLQQTFPIGYSTQEAAVYHVFLTQFDAFFDTHGVYLHDLWTGVIHDLKSGPYSFASDSGVFHERFQVRFTNETLGVELPTFSKDILVVQALGSLSVQAVQTTMKVVELFDMTGRLLMSRNTNGSVLEHLNTIGIERQAVLLKITDQEGKVHYKKTIVY